MAVSDLDSDGTGEKDAAGSLCPVVLEIARVIEQYFIFQI